jgi:cell wall-associated NlpC family hydrolase
MEGFGRKKGLFGPPAAISTGMRSLNGHTVRDRAAFFCCALVIFLAVSPNTHARTRRHRAPTPFTVALEPFRLTRAVVHAAAAPVVHNVPRVLAATAAPIKLAYYAPRRLKPRPPRGAEIDFEADEESDSRPIRVAYATSGRAPTAAPRAEEVVDEQETDEESGAIQQRGDRPMVSGNRAVLRNGVAYAPSNAPQSVKNAIWAANTLRRKPYVWGGGHGSFSDRGYDCSGTVSFALHGAGALSSPLPSSDLMRYGERGRGRWMTIYSRSGHTFAMIAGLRLDTTDLGRGGDVGPRWYDYSRDTGGYVARHPVGM